MKEILTVDDPIELAFLKSVFEHAGIQMFVLDEHINGLLGGSFSPCRIMVSESDFEAALDLLDDLDAQLANETNDDDN